MVLDFDIIIIGGGINGCGIAADAAMRGLKTLLIEKHDLASQTSSNSTKLIHGGLRYLELYDFLLVKKSLDERQVLQQVAPHLVEPLSFVIPYKKQLRPAWLLRLGLFLYDHLSRKNRLPNSQYLQRRKHADLFSPLTTSYQKGFLFYDCRTNDSRLTLCNALQAKEYGAQILTNTELMTGNTKEGHWHLSIKTKNHSERLVTTRAVVNAAGPWVETVNQRLGINNQHPLTLVKGSHILINKLYEGSHAYLLQNQDSRIVFTIPYYGFTMIGTTEVIFPTPAENLSIAPEEIDYLLAVTHRYFKKIIKPQDILHSWCGTRTLVEHNEEKSQQLSRDYKINLCIKPAPTLLIYGGKLTTYRQLACEAMDALKYIFPQLKPCRTAEVPLPGSQPPDSIDFHAYLSQLNERYSWLEKATRMRLLKEYGTRVDIMLKHCDCINDMGQDFGHGLYQIEVDYLMKEEWACNAEDILWRRTQLGLIFNDKEKAELNRYLTSVAADATDADSFLTA